MTFLSLLLLFSISMALIFDLINGFHDAANSIATVVSTRVLAPSAAVLWAAFFNFLPIVLFTPKVADTVAQIVIISDKSLPLLVVICTGLLGAIVWNLLTWWLKLPTSSSHALIGGLSGAGMAYGGASTLRWDKLIETAEFILIAPLLGLFLGYFIILLVYWLNRHSHPGQVDRRFRRYQLFSAALYSIGHGANDAQKTMGVILALMIAAGFISPGTPLSLSHPETVWIIIVCQLAMSLGTALGGWRIVKTMGMKIAKLKPVGGFCAESAGAFTLFLATHSGIPVSTTHTITGSIIGTSLAIYPASKIKWLVASQILWAWILTLPCTAIVSACMFFLFKFFYLTLRMTFMLH